MYTLFIDTHNSLITIGLVNQNNCFKLEKESPKSHGSNLLPMIDTILKENNVSFKALDEIIVVNGPGSFTGLRIGLTVAKTMAYALDIPIRTISTLYAYLISSDVKEKKVCIIEDTKGYYVGLLLNNNLEEKYTEDIEDIKNYKIVLNNLNIKKIYEQKDKLELVNAHLVKANYVKKIEAEINE